MSEFYDQQPEVEAEQQPEVDVEQQPKPAKKKRVLPWVALAAVLGILVGAACVYFAPDIAGKTEATVSIPYDVEVQTVAPTLKTNSVNKSLTPAEVYAQNVGAVVGVSTESTAVNIFGQRTSRAASGTGFVLSEDGYVVTNNHVVSGANTIKVTLNSGETYEAKLIGSYAANDVALLKISAENLQAVTVGKSSDLIVGERVAAIGNPLGELTNSMTVGYVSAVDREVTADGKQINMIQTDVAINSGNSGGPLFDMNGNVVGIITAKYSGQTNSGMYIEGLSFAIPLDDVIDQLMELQTKGYISGRPRLGVTLQDLSASTAEVYGLPVGPYVQSVEAGSCADKAGIEKGDIILSLGGTEVQNYAALVSALNKHKAGETVEIVIYRAGVEKTLTATLDEYIESAETQAVEQPTEQEIQTITIPGFGGIFPW